MGIEGRSGSPREMEWPRLPMLAFLAFVAALVISLTGVAKDGRHGDAELVRFVAIGDSGTGMREQFSVANAMEACHEVEPFDLVLMLGDNIYGGVKGRRSFTDRFEKPYSRLLEKRVQFYAALGNHGSLRAETQYEKFNMGGHPYYTFTKGNDLVQFFALDTLVMDRKQLEWLEGELGASRALWKIAFYHHPIYSSGRKHGASVKLRNKIEPLFVKYGVHVALSGHDHFYQRFKPQQGVVYFVSGSAGKLRLRDIDRSDDQMAAGNDEVCHFLLFEATRGHLAFRAVGATGEVLDSGAIDRVQPVAAGAGSKQGF